jgi:hypothetical protein
LDGLSAHLSKSHPLRRSLWRDNPGERLILIVARQKGVAPLGMAPAATRETFEEYEKRREEDLRRAFQEATSPAPGEELVDIYAADSH